MENGDHKSTQLRAESLFYQSEDLAYVRFSSKCIITYTQAQNHTDCSRKNNHIVISMLCYSFLALSSHPDAIFFPPQEQRRSLHDKH